MGKKLLSSGLSKFVVRFFYWILSVATPFGYVGLDTQRSRFVSVIC